MTKLLMTTAHVTNGVANKDYSGLQSLLFVSILVYFDKLTSPLSPTGHTINPYTKVKNKLL